MAGKKKNQVHRLEDLVVEEVSVVDKPANQRPFLVVKNKDGKVMATKGKEIQRDKNGNLVTKGDDNNDAPTNEPVDIAKAFADLGLAVVEVDEKGGEIIEKRLSISSAQRTELFRSLGDAMRRASTAMTMVDFADTDSGEGGSTLVPVLAQEFAEVGKAFTDAAKALGKSSTKKNDDQSEANEIENKLEALIESVEAELVEKTSVSKGSIDKIKSAISALNSIVNELSGGKAEGAKPGAAGDKSDADKRGKTKKNDESDDEVVSLRKNVEVLTGNVEKLTGVIERQNKEIVTLKKARPASNVIGAGQRQETRKNEDEDDTHWGLDLNDEKDRESVDKSVSFHD